MEKNKASKGYKSVSTMYDDYILAEKWLFRIIAKIIWGFVDKEYSITLLENIPDGFSGKLLDIPAGTGVLTCEKYLKIKNAHIICMDYSKDMLDRAKERFEKTAVKNIECRQGDVGRIPFEDEMFDIIVSMNGFHAFPDKEKAFEEIKRVLKDRGLFIGCFYIKGVVKRTDWFIKNIFVRNGTFTPPFYSKDEVIERFNKEYREVALWNKGSIVCFKCKK